MKRLLILFTTILLSQIVCAQDYKYDIGVAGGIAYYLGDANQYRPYSNNVPAMGGVFRYNHNLRWAFKGSLTYMVLEGNTALFDNRLPAGKDVFFHSHVGEAAVMAEFNFLPYGIGYEYLETCRISPYLTVGGALDLTRIEGEWGLKVAIPFGVGVKWKIIPRLNLSLQVVMAKTITDALDGWRLKAPNGIESSWLKNTDWYSTTLLSVTYEFGLRKKICNNIE